MSGVAVVGAGGWGTALALMLVAKGVRTTLWVRNPSLAGEICSSRVNQPYLPGVTLPKSLAIESDLAHAVEGKRAIVLAVPSQGMREMCGQLAGMLHPATLVINAAKGLERETLFRMSEVIESCLSKRFRDQIVTLSGPNHAEEVSRMVPSASVVAASNPDAASRAQTLLMSSSFRVYTNSDLIGVEVAGAIKNVLALAAGISDGLGFGDNTKAALMTRGMAEMARIGVAMGARPLTFAGLAGMGDLIATCVSRHSRNTRCGRAIGEGKTLKEVLDSTPMVVEGVFTAVAARHLSKRLNVEMPIASKVYEVLFEGRDAREAVSELMERDAAREETSFMSGAYQLS